MTATQSVRIGTRASTLARWQADWVAGRLRERGVAAELVLISTEGDRSQAGPIGQIGGQGVFTKELQRAMLEQRVDLAVHSLKDLPTEPVEGLIVTAVPERAPAGDALVCQRFASLDELPPGAVVGTGSLRRRTQLWHVRPDLKMNDIRGNVDTRLKKLAEGRFDALVLAEAGLRRLGLDQHIRQVLPKTIVLPAVGQGALGLETRSDDQSTRTLVAPLNDPRTQAAVTAERALLFALHGGCLAPVGAWARFESGDLLRLDASVLSSDGALRIHASLTAAPADADQLGRDVAQNLLAQGAAELIRQSREPAD